MKGAWAWAQNESHARGAYIVAFDTANEVVAVGVGRALRARASSLLLVGNSRASRVS